MPRGIGSRCGVKADLVVREVKLLDQLAEVAVSKDGVDRQVVGCVHEVRRDCRRLSGSAHTGLGVADDAVVEIDDAGLQQRGKREDDGGGVAAGVRDEPGVGDRRRVQLG